MTASSFTYDNRTGRPPGRAVRAMSAVLPGAAQVWARVEPYADAWRTHNLAAIGQPGRRWIVLGDSLSQGVGASAYDNGWVGKLASLLKSTGHDINVINLSATGARVRDVLDQQLPALELLGVREQDLVTVMIGSNDLFGSRERRDKLPSAFAALIDRLPRGSVVATLPNPRSAAQRANKHIELAARTGRIVMADLRVTGPTSWRGRLAGDFFHPNDAGYAAIATGLEPTHREVLASQDETAQTLVSAPPAPTDAALGAGDHELPAPTRTFL